MAKKKIDLSINTFVLILCFFAFAGCAAKQQAVLFSYDKLLSSAFRDPGTGRVIPVAVEKSTEIDGTISADGKYLFYASDKERGNFDIYLRSLNGVETVRVTKHPSKDFSPAISPDGKYLAFVSLRDDPQGDIYVLKVNPGRMIEDATRTSDTDYEKNLNNITQIIDPSTNAPVSVRDTDPAWSPDGDFIAFSSTRESGVENIWIVSRSGKNLRQITTKGGIHPRFSHDGARIVFVSYRDNPQGDIYLVDAAGGNEKRITSSPGLKIYPSFGETDNDIVYTLIDKDTNHDRRIDFRDNSTIIYLNLSNGLSYPLTMASVSSFRPRYFPVYALQDPITKVFNYNGVIVYGEQTGENININVIPSYGIIPRRNSASAQYDLADVYRLEDNDVERYLLALMRVYYFFGARNDSDSIIYSSRALYDASTEYRRSGDVASAAKAEDFLRKLSKKQKDYPWIKTAILEALNAGKDVSPVFDDALKTITSGAELPFVREDAAGYYLSRGDKTTAAALYEKIIKESAKYPRIASVKFNLGKIEFDHSGIEIPETCLDVYRSGSPSQRDSVALDIVKIYQREKDLRKRITIIEKKYAEASTARSPLALLLPVFEYSLALAYQESGDFAKAETWYKKALAPGRLRTTEIFYYEVNTALARLAVRDNKSDVEESYLFQAANNYLPSWNRPDFRTIIARLVSYYETKGADLESSGDYKKASDLYGKYVRLMTQLHNRKKFEDIYSENAPRANVLFVDAFVAAKNSVLDGLVDLETKYLNGDGVVMADINVARLNYNRAQIYGLAYIYVRRAAELNAKMDSGDLTVTDNSIIEGFKKAEEQISWAIFMDDSFVDPYLLQGWINQMIDIRRKELSDSNSGTRLGRYNDSFPDHLWERNKSVYEKGLEENDAAKYPDKEGALHLNLANSLFLLQNYPAALEHYEQVMKFKKGFGSRKEEDLFRYHLSYCYWQMGETKKARAETQRILDSVRSSDSSTNRRLYAEKLVQLYARLALYDRFEKNYSGTIKNYGEMLREAIKGNVPVDVSRTYLDIAWCYGQIGRDKSAESYLARADALLKNEKDNDPTFKLQVRLFYLIGFSVYDLGPDAVVIGNSKIFSVLSTAQKKLLSLGISEQIHFRRGEFRQAADYAKKRMDIFKDRKSAGDHDGYLRSLNSLGFYMFQLGRYNDAKEYFEKGWSFAIDPDINNMDGAFVSIQNLADLESCLVENSIAPSSEKITAVSGIIARIDKYQKDYEAARFKERNTDLEKEAKARGTSVTEEDTAKLRKNIAAEAREKYSELELSRATLDFYRAELSGSTVMKADDPYLFYRSSADLYAVYRNAAESFLAASDKTGIDSAKKGRLIMNAAICRMKNGLYQKSYELFGNAEKIFNSVSRNDLLWELYYREAELLRDFGSEIDKDSLRLAESCFKKASAIIEESPALYASYAAKIVQLYNDYASFMVKRNDTDRALALYEKGYAVSRVISVYLDSPRFGRETDRENFNAYLSLVAQLKEKLAQRSLLQTKNTPPDSADFKKCEKEIKDSKASLDALLAGVRANNKTFYSLIFPESSLPSKSEMGNRIACRIEQTGDALTLWRYGRISDAVSFPPENAIGRVAALMSEGGDSVRYLVFNDTAVKILSEARQGLPAFSFVPSIERVRVLSVPRDFATLKDITLKSGEQKNEPSDLLPFDLVSGDSEKITEALYARRAVPTLVAASLSDIGSAQTLLEAAIYSQGASVIFTKNDALLKSIKSYEGDILGLNSDSLNYVSLSGGTKSVSPDKMAILGSGFRKDAETALKEGDAVRAIASSLRAEDFAKDSLASIRARAYEMSSDKKSIEAARTALSSQKPEDVSYYLYLLFSKGDFIEADKTLLLYNAFSSQIPEWQFYLKLSESAKNGGQPNTIESSLVDSSRLTLLAARISSALGNQKTFTGGASKQSTYPMSDSQILLQLLYPGTENANISRKTSELASVVKETNLPLDRALASTSPADPLLIYPVIASLRGKAFSDPATLRLVELSRFANADIPDLLVLLDLYAKRTHEAGLDAEYEKALDEMIAVAKKGGISYVYASAVLEKCAFQNSRGEYKESMKELTGNDLLLVLPASLQISHTLLLAECDIFTGNIPHATDVLQKSDPKEPGDLLVKDLLLAHAERMKILQNREYAKQGIILYEQYMNQAIPLLTSGLYSVFHRQDLLARGLDFMVSFNASRQNNSQALYYEEIKKQLLRWKYIAANDALLKTARAAEFQKNLPEDSVALYISRNEDDLIAWIIDRDYINPVGIAGGYAKAMKIVSAYSKALDEMKSAVNVSRDLDALLSPVLGNASSRKAMYIIPDEFTEKIPFEIAGKDLPLAKRTAIYYLSSISSVFQGNSFGGKGFVMAGDPASLDYELDNIAISRSGLILARDQNASICHVSERAAFQNGTFSVSSGIVPGAHSVLYLARGADSEYTGVAAESASRMNLPAMVYSSPSVLDVNVSLFASDFYYRMHEGMGCSEAFTAAAREIMSQEKFSHPAYWAGVRLYLNRLQHEREEQ